MDLTTLTSKYQDLLQQYKELNNEYVTYLNSVSSQQLNQDFQQIPKSAYTGDIITNSSSNSASLCQATCAKTSGCLGATFTNTKNACILQSGNGKIESNANTVAIVSKQTYYLTQLTALSNQLLAINQNIQNYLDTNQDSLADEIGNVNGILTDLRSNLFYLNNQQKDYMYQLDSIKDINNDLTNSEAQREFYSNKYSTMWTILAVVLIIAMFLVFFTSDVGSSLVEKAKETIEAPNAVQS